MRPGKRPPSPWRTRAESAALGLLLLALVVSAVAGYDGTFLLTVVAGWFLLPLIVGLEGTLDAGLVFMVVAMGIFVAVGFARLILQAGGG